MRIRAGWTMLGVVLALASVLAIARLERPVDARPASAPDVTDREVALGEPSAGLPAPIVASRERATLPFAEGATEEHGAAPAAWSLDVRVTDSEGEPVADARCALHLRDDAHRFQELALLASDARGEALFPRITEESVTLTVAAPGYARWYHTAAALPGDTRRVVVALAPELPLDVLVTESWGAPIEGARVVAWTGTDAGTEACPCDWEVGTDPEGIGRLLGLAATAPALELRVEAPGHCTARRTVRRGPSAEPVEIVLLRAGRFDVRVEDTTGRPLAAEVEVAAAAGMSGYESLGWLEALPLRISTDHQDRTHPVEGVPIGLALDVLARVAGAPVASAEGVVLAHGRERELVLVAPPHVSVEVRLADRDVRGGRVTLDSTEGLRTLPVECVFRRAVPLSYAAAMDAKGGAALDVRPGGYRLSVRDPLGRLLLSEDVRIEGPTKLDLHPAR